MKPGGNRMNGPLLRAAVLGGLLACMATAQAQTAPAYGVVGDAIAAPLTTQPGDATRGRAIVVNRQVGLCLLCHSGSLPEERFQGNLVLLWMVRAAAGVKVSFA